MRQAELEDKIDETKSFIADKLRDITGQADSLKMKTPDEEIKVKQILTKISDFIDEIYNGYGTLEQLQNEPVDDDNPDDDGYFGY